MYCLSVPKVHFGSLSLAGIAVVYILLLLEAKAPSLPLPLNRRGLFLSSLRSRLNLLQKNIEN
jgi:hypothetical protein